MDGPSTSQEISTCFDPSPNAQLTLRADPESKKLMKCDESDAEFAVNLGKLDLEELIVEPWFQDNTMVFDVLLNDRKSFVMCIYPPGSGKSTMAQLLKFYLSANGMHEEIRKFLDTSEFQLKENELAKDNPSYKKFRASASYVLIADFTRIKGRTQGGLELNYTLYMEQCWLRSGLPEQTVNRELKNLSTVEGSVWTSLERLRDSIHPASGELYVILDSVDNMYNLIANLPPEESKKLYSQFTKGISTIIHKGTHSIKTFCFGVSPYLIQAFRKYAVSCYYIGSSRAKEYFSYQDIHIQRMIDEWKLGISTADCKKVAEFKFNDNSFVNPYLCISYLKSLHENGASFSVDISPRSLWLKCIFTEDDLKLLYGVLSKDEDREFKSEVIMTVSMNTMCVLPEETKYRQLYYPLFIYGGYLSCKRDEMEKNIYSLSPANETSKILLYHHLETLNYRKFKVTLSDCQKFLQEYINQDFDNYCKNLSLLLPAQSSYIIREERPYHTFMAGILSPLMLNGYHLEFNKEFSVIKPDTLIRKDIIIIEEYKHVTPPSHLPKYARKAVAHLQGSERCDRLNEFYNDVENVSREQIVKLCQEAVIQARHQLSIYAPQFSSQYCKDVQVNIVIFFVSQVILLHGTYFYERKIFSQYEIYSSKGYFEDEHLQLILNAE